MQRRYLITLVNAVATAFNLHYGIPLVLQRDFDNGIRLVLEPIMDIGQNWAVFPCKKRKYHRIWAFRWPIFGRQRLSLGPGSLLLSQESL
jgi:hypothetical protein